VILHEAEICHVAMEIEHGRPALRLAICTLLPLARADRSCWVAAAAARISHRLRTRGARAGPFSPGEQALLSGTG
jgi:hypothetical protein